MVKRMLIDATHAEETRVVVLDGNRLEEFDFETSTKKQIKGNIYLAKVTRVEPSLQAAFVEYGGNRHGFLAFSEIHPDYYRIPQADRDALMRETLELQRDYDTLSEAVHGRENESDLDGEPSPGREALEDGDDMLAQPAVSSSLAIDGDIVETAEEPIETVEVLGGDDFEDASPRRRSYRNYKIQEVIARRQILLVQVVKEERGNKGAALTTYLSLAGRYCVLMPNTPRGGGVSRKITSLTDRKRLKSILDDLQIPEGVAVIMRTAGLDRPRAEIHRDYEYLLRLWNEIRETTLASSAPALIHEEGNLIKRAIRDLYSRDIDEVWVEGEEGYRTAKSFIRTIIPNHVKRVLPYRDPAIPLMNRFQVEAQLDAIHNPVVQLRSGGYIVINPTEALVAIDVNSGRATKERHIEETACKTNLEAAEEIARQVRLRDLAGLIVIDFIDMEENRNSHTVERRLKEAMKGDRARIQLGRISPFGLLELSRQRLRPSLIEASTEKCPHCNGSGVIRSTESAALHVLRAIEDEGIRGRALELLVYAPTNIALYILNQKRDKLADIERRYSFDVQIDRDDGLIQPDYRIERLRLRAPGELPAFMTAASLPPLAADEDYDEGSEEEIASDADNDGDSDSDAEGDHRAKRRRRRRRRGSAPAAETAGDKLSDDSHPGGVEIVASDEEESGVSDALSLDESGDEDRDHRRRRRGRRGGRRRLRDGEGGALETSALLSGPDPAEPHPDTGMAGDGLAIDALPVPLSWPEHPLAAPMAEEVVATDPQTMPQPMPIPEAAESVVGESATLSPPIRELPPPATESLAMADAFLDDSPLVSSKENASAEQPAVPAKARRAPSRKKTPRPASDMQATELALSDKADKAAAKPKKRSSTRRTAVKSEPLATATADRPAESIAPESAPAFLPAMTVTVIDEPPPRRRAGWWQRN